MRQVVAVVIAAQLLCAILLAALALLHERRTHLRTFDVRVQGRSDSLLGAIQDAEDPEDSVQVDREELPQVEGDVYAVYNQNGRLLGSSSNAVPQLIARYGDGFRDVQVNRRRYRVLQSEALRIIDRAENGGVGLRRPVTIVYASPQGEMWRSIFEAVRFYLIAIAAATVVTVLFVGLLLRRTLSPLSALTAAAGRLVPPSLDFAAPASVTSVRELRPLAEVLATTMNRLREAFAKEQQFIGDAAHELKTAVAVVRSSVQLLMMKRRTAAEYEVGLDRILSDNARVEALVSQMLELASVDEAPQTEAPPLRFDEQVQTVLQHLQPVAEQHGVRLRSSCCETQISLRPADARTLLSNLILNAVQHSPTGETVDITLTRTAHGRPMLRVLDQGPGVSKEALPHLFDRFYREDTSRSRETGGAGLGLSICKSIVDGAGGLITIENRPGGGTEVKVVFISA